MLPSQISREHHFHPMESSDRDSFHARKKKTTAAKAETSAKEKPSQIMCESSVIETLDRPLRKFCGCHTRMLHPLGDLPANHFTQFLSNYPCPIALGQNCDLGPLANATSGLPPNNGHR